MAVEAARIATAQRKLNHDKKKLDVKEKKQKKDIEARAVESERIEKALIADESQKVGEDVQLPSQSTSTITHDNHPPINDEVDSEENDEEDFQDHTDFDKILYFILGASIRSMLSNLVVQDLPRENKLAIDVLAVGLLSNLADAVEQKLPVGVTVARSNSNGGIKDATGNLIGLRLLCPSQTIMSCCAQLNKMSLLQC